MVSLSYRRYDPLLKAYYWVEGEQWKASQVLREASRLASEGCLSIHWQSM